MLSFYTFTANRNLLSGHASYYIRIQGQGLWKSLHSMS
jgi:hypothetical protein